MVKDLCSEAVAAAYPMPQAAADTATEDLVEAEYVVDEERHRRVEELRDAWDEGIIEDPLLTLIAEQRHARDQAEARIRRLVAYGRQFHRPRPYPLSQLATAAGMSISGIRTCYGDRDVDTVAHNIHRDPPGGSTVEEDPGDE